VLAALGAGGMGEVYRARDARLGRDVALKLLPEAFAADAERMARFEREAQVLASLNHAHIAALYGLEESGGVRALVMELAEGPTLAERIAAGPLPPEEALPVAKQIAEALEYAHERGVVHRDLKPANIKVTRDAAVKVLDFGLAKALEGGAPAADASNSPTLTMAATRAGVILGTAAYMSPEQARGKPADRRADVWAFGCVLYEMLAGRPLFAGETVGDTLAAVIRADPDWNGLPAATPAALRRLLRRCLEKDAKRRLRDIGEARIVLEDVLSGRAEAEATAAAGPAGTRPAPRFIPLAVAVALTALVTAGAMRLLRPNGAAPVRKFELPAPALESAAVVSPDGRQIAYVAHGRLWVRPLNQLEPRELSGTDGAEYPFWSFDSSSLAYFAQTKLWRVPATGGERVVIAEFRAGVVGGAGGAWKPDNTIVFSLGNTELYEVSARGGPPRLYLAPAPEEDHFHAPTLLPDGKTLLFSVHPKQGLLWVAAYDGRTRKEVLKVEKQALDYATYSPSGHLVYQVSPENAGVWAVPFDLSRMKVTSEPFLLVSNGTRPSLAQEGTLVCTRGQNAGIYRLVQLNREGKEVSRLGETVPNFSQEFSVSPDGRRVAVSATDTGGLRDIWILDIARGGRTRLTFSPQPDFQPAWSPKGDLVAYHQGGILHMKRADGSGEEEHLGTGWAPAFSPDGRYLVFAYLRSGGGSDLAYFPLAGDRKPVRLSTGRFREDLPSFSPTGEFLAFQSDESGLEEIYVRRFPSGEGKWQVSVSGGNHPVWSPRGDRIFYKAGQDLMEVEVSLRPEFAVGKPRKVLTVPPSSLRAFQVMPDGKHFLFPVWEGAARDTTGVVVILNWSAESRR
jgi:Tol biopolymer transport system component